MEVVCQERERYPVHQSSTDTERLTTMQASDITDVLFLSHVLDSYDNGTDESEAETIGALLRWRDGNIDGEAVFNASQDGTVDQGTDAAKVPAKRGKAKAEAPEPDSFEATPDPASDEPDF